MLQDILEKPFGTDFWSKKAAESSYKINEDLSFKFAPFQLNKDIPTLHHWVNLPYAKYWQLGNSSVETVYDSYKEILDGKNTCVFWGVLNDKKVFLVEFYYAPKDRMGKHYDAQIGDYGFHILAGPKETVISQFTTHIFVYLLTFLFQQEEVERVVVEPDVNNDKIHALNKRAGFKYDKKIEFEEKTAYLAFNDRAQFQEALHHIQLP
ncbi:GNAT family N-acetyltransferase [Flammeovirga aprica]|uniref:Acetyltransferase n=1 Tax=Flammeovirga aprica JL-4 TaxID=694437 RepID=A0A7X9P2G2_9BACT|nr:GNAT family N-acetyltransferase [Flammeovirga aprica]NME67948.1 acetyltransferase [Flammeovirga aprica JL-4]